MGAVGAAAPTDFEENSFFAQDFHTKIPLAYSLWSVYENLHAQF